MKRTTLIIIALFAAGYIAFLTCVAIESRNVIPLTYIAIADTTDVEYTSIPIADADTLTLGIDNERQRVFGGLTGELRIVAADTVGQNRLVVPQQLKRYFIESVARRTVSIVIGDTANSPMVINCSVPITVYLKQLPASIENHLSLPLNIAGGTADSLKIATTRELELSAIAARKVTVGSRYGYNDGQGSCRVRVNDAAKIDTLCIGNQFHNANVATDSLSTVGNLVMLTPGKTAITADAESNIGNFSFPAEQGEKSLIIKSTESFEFSNINK